MNTEEALQFLAELRMRVVDMGITSAGSLSEANMRRLDHLRANPLQDAATVGLTVDAFVNNLVAVSEVTEGEGFGTASGITETKSFILTRKEQETRG